MSEATLTSDGRNVMDMTGADVYELEIRGLQYFIKYSLIKKYIERLDIAFKPDSRVGDLIPDAMLALIEKEARSRARPLANRPVVPASSAEETNAGLEAPP
jgi:hypothetical protein